MPEAPAPPTWFLKELRHIDKTLGLMWDWERLAYWLVSRLGEGDNMVIVPYALYAKEDLNTLNLQGIREGIRLRDQGVTVEQRLAEREARKVAQQEIKHAELDSFVEQQAKREAECLGGHGKKFALGDADNPTTADVGNREDGAFSE